MGKCSFKKMELIYAGSETTTYKDLQIQPLMSHPEKVYANSDMLED